ncbi:hypothetical protein NMY22_g4050 [Coprinellus aureogranulatus]|nr:hypothetical protein NMY22_g4050 [Coprinellus aureogranulatus]
MLATLLVTAWLLGMFPSCLFQTFVRSKAAPPYRPTAGCFCKVDLRQHANVLMGCAVGRSDRMASWCLLPVHASVSSNFVVKDALIDIATIRRLRTALSC